MTTLVGIDPGITGAIAFIRDEDVVAIEDMPTRPLPVGEHVSRRVDGGKLFDLLQRYCRDDEVRIFVEHVRIIPSKDKDRTVQSEGSLVRTLGAIEAVCDVFGVPPVLVTAQQWQAHFGLVSKKRELRERGALPEAMTVARKLYPRAAALMARVKDNGKADALLIGHYGASLMEA